MGGVTHQTEAGARYLASIAADCAACLGPGIDLLDVRADDQGDEVRLVCLYRLGARTSETVGSGPTLLEAHGDLRARLVVDRLRLSFGAVVESK